MELINWQIYDYNKFTLFCNALLSLEVSKSFIPFSAPGKDNGIDGTYVGKYAERTGRWRFQYKFHNQDRKGNVNALKQDLAKELKNITTEDHFVLLTNVELLPQQRAELLGTAELQLTTDEHNVTVDIWDGAKLHTLYLQFPILRLWMEEGFATAVIVKYTSYFGDRLSRPEDLRINTLSNEFTARESDLTYLNDFLSSDNKMLIIAGDAGIGKTRLVIEFFKKSIDKNDSWQAFVLNTKSRSPDFDKILISLSNKTNSIILIDDAHLFPAEVIADFHMLTYQTNIPGHIKIILTTHSLYLPQVRKLIPVLHRERITQLLLSKLSPNETLTYFKDRLKNHQFINYVDDISRISNGRPILMVAILRAIQQGRQISQIKSDANLKEYVAEYFNAVTVSVSSKTNFGTNQISNLLSLICLTEPINKSDQKLIEALCEISNTSRDVFETLIKELINANLILDSWEISVTPDFYSDIFLERIPKSLIERTIDSLPDLINHAIINMVSVTEDSAYDARAFHLDYLIELYIAKARTGGYSEMVAILDTIADIAFAKPDAAVKVLQTIVARLKSGEQDLLRYFSKKEQHSVGYHSKANHSISVILSNLLYFPERQQFVFDLVYFFYTLDQRLSTFGETFGLNRMAAIKHFDFELQNIFLDKSEKLIQARRLETFQYLIQAFKELLKLDFQVSGNNFLERGTISIITYYLPSSERVYRFRERTIGFLFRIYESDEVDKNIKLQVMKELLDIPREISATSRNKEPYRGTNEVKILLEFLLQKSASAALEEKKAIIDNIYWYKKWKIDPQFNPLLEAIQKNLAPQTLSEKLLQLMTDNQFKRPGKYQETLTAIRGISSKVFMHYNPKEIAGSLEDISTSIQDPNIFLNLLHGLLENDASKSEDVFDLLFEMRGNTIQNFGSYFLHSLRFLQGQSTFFWNRVKDLEKLESDIYNNIILHVYSIGEPKALQPEDASLVTRLFERRTEKNEYTLVHALKAIFDFDPKIGSDLIIKFLDSCNQRAADHFFLFFIFKERDYNFTKLFTLEHTFRFELSYEIQRALTLVLEKEGFKTIFQYFINRFNILCKQIADQKYGYRHVPYSFEDNHITREKGTEDKITYFKHALDWYLDLDLTYKEIYYAIDLVEFFQGTSLITEPLIKIYDDLVGSSDNVERLIRIIESMQMFTNKSEPYIELVLRATAKAIRLSESEDCNEKIGTASYNAITRVGLKTGIAGQPFAADVALLKIVENSLAKENSESFESRILQSVKRSLERDINNELEKDRSMPW
jgi:hypothetical protein